MSLTTSNSEVQAQVSKGLDRARQAVTRVTPVAKSTGATAAQGIANARSRAVPRIGQGVRDARQWAAPRVERGVHDAREWAAPRIERAAHAVEETVAPKVSGLLTATAHRVDPSSASSPGRRRWVRLLAGITLISALGGIVAGILRKRGAALPDAVMPDEEMTGTDAEHSPETGESTEEVMVEAEVGVNGKGTAS